MRLARFEVHNLRSISHQSLESCGSFNVLIGKNNSGKSNLLSGIAFFFDFFARGTLASRQQSIVSNDDHFMRQSSEDIVLICSMRLGQTAMSAVFDEIAAEFPQVRGAVPVPTELDQLHLEVVYRTSPIPTSFVRAIDYEACDPDGSLTGERRPLLQVSDEAGEELAARAEELKELRTDIHTLHSSRPFDRDDWELLKQHSSPYLSSIFRERLGARQRTELQRIVSRAPNAEMANEALQEHVESLQGRLAFLETAPMSTTIQLFAGTSDSVPSYILNLLDRLRRFKVLHLADRRRPIGSAEASRLLELKTSRGGAGTLRSIQQTVSTLLGVEIDAFSSSPFLTSRTNTGTKVDAELDVGDFLVQVNGSGVREALRLILDLEFQKPDLLLVEEPEVHLHPALEVAMMRHLKAVSGTTQVFLTTHSTNFLDTGDMRNIYMVRNESETSVRHLNIDDAEDELPQELGIRLSSVFMYDSLVFVEGTSDELAIRAFAQTLGYNLGQSNVGFVAMGSARNFTHFAAQATVNLLTKRSVRSVFILDRDEKQDSEIEKLARQLNGHAHLHVLARREMENYLLHNPSVARFIEQKTNRSGRRSITVTADDIALATDEVAEDLREFSICKKGHVAPLRSSPS